MLQNRLSRRLSAGLILLFLGSSAAVANPKINEVLTAYSTAGAPISINILGTILCTGSPCVAPIVTLGGKSVSISAYSPTSITVKQPLTLGDYTLKVVNASGSTTFELTLANLATQGPAGPGAMLVKDSNGKVIGSYFYATSPMYSQSDAPTDNVFIRTSSLSFAVPFTGSQLGGFINGWLYYTSSDCTGTGYVTTSGTTGSAHISPAVPFAIMIGTVAYVGAGGATILTITANSRLRGDTSMCEVDSITLGSVVPVVATFDLSTLKLVPPFTVH